MHLQVFDTSGEKKKTITVLDAGALAATALGTGQVFEDCLAGEVESALVSGIADLASTLLT